jgi:hypothetical protein
MSTAAAAQTNPHVQKSGPGGQAAVPTTFEFTKRKRWADLLVAELADGINFVLSLSCKVLYCSPAAKELVGWRDLDLIDCDFVELIAGKVLSFQSVSLFHPQYFS